MDKNKIKSSGDWIDFINENEAIISECINAVREETAKEIFKDIEKAYINEDGVADCNKLEEELPRIAKKWSSKSKKRSEKNDM